MNLLIFSGLYDHKLISKIAPIIELKKVENIYLVRNKPLDFEKIHSLTPPRFVNFPLLRELFKLFQGIHLCRSRKIDAILGFYLRPHGLLAYWLGRLFQKPVIQVFIGNDVDFVLKHKNIFKKVLHSAHHIGVRGEQSKIRLNDIVNNDKKFFIPQNTYKLNLSSKAANTEKDIDVLCIADFSKVKRIDIFLKTMVQVKKKHHSLFAVMLGSGKRQAVYEKMLTRLKLRDNVNFLGKVEDVYSYLHRSRVFLLTSEAEGLPMSMIEAMSAGVPCVVPNVGDICDIAKDGKNAFVVEPLHIEDFASRIFQLLFDQDLAKRLSSEAKKTLQNKEKIFSLEYNTKIWDKILD
jgi:glycosyltransferase involved in cell wall biosynthesis